MSNSLNIFANAGSAGTLQLDCGQSTVYTPFKAQLSFKKFGIWIDLFFILGTKGCSYCKTSVKIRCNFFTLHFIEKLHMYCVVTVTAVGTIAADTGVACTAPLSTTVEGTAAVDTAAIAVTSAVLLLLQFMWPGVDHLRRLWWLSVLVLDQPDVL